MAFSKDFWDVFPDNMTKLWWGFMVVLLVATAFWHERIFTWCAEQPALLILGIFLLLILVFIGNYIPGVPNMLLPLLAGWAFGAGAPFNTVLTVSALTWIFAALGSKMIFAKARHNPGMVYDWNLHSSERFRKAQDVVRTEPHVVLKSRIGKFAAYCGHVNIAAGIANYPNSKFVDEIMLGHGIWTVYYVIGGAVIALCMPRWYIAVPLLTIAAIIFWRKKRTA